MCSSGLYRVCGCSVGSAARVLKRPILAFRATSAYAVMVVAIAFGAALASTQVQAAVGRTAGSHSVGNDASFNYTIAIFTPPGPRGMRGL